VSKLDRNLNPFKKLYCAYPKNSETGVSPDVASLMSVAAAREQKKDKNTQGARERERELAARCIGEKKREVGERKKNCYSPFFLGLINGTPLFSTFCPDLGPTAAAAEMEREPFFVLLLFCARRRPRHRRRYFYTSCPFFPCTARGRNQSIKQHGPRGVIMIRVAKCGYLIALHHTRNRLNECKNSVIGMCLAW
jgi:hypothetical protein